jgi:lipopolysaccharide export system protein LptC
MKIYYSIAAIIVLSLVFWLIPIEKNKDVPFQFARQPEEYMSQVTVWNFSETGDLKHYLSAAYWAYLPETASSNLTTPHLIVYKPDQTIWQIDAERGNVKQPSIGHIDQVELQGSVVMQRLATKTEMPIKVETQVIRYQPKKEYAETDQLITLRKPDLTITGTGMRAFLDKNFVELLHNVKTCYVPNMANNSTNSNVSNAPPNIPAASHVPNDKLVPNATYNAAKQKGQT